MTQLRPIRVLVTRARNQASALADLLEAAGATPILIPTIEIAPPSSYEALDDALRSLPAYDWLLFTSANAVEVFAQRSRELGVPLELGRVAVIGPATAKAAREKLQVAVDRMPERFVAESLAEALREEAPAASMLLVRAEVARDLLPELLREAGARVTIVDAYRNVVPEDSIVKVRELFVGDPPEAITFTSASTARNLRELLEAAAVEIPAGTILASIGPITSEAMRQLGWEPSVEAQEATIASLVAGLLQAVGMSKPN